MAYDASNNQQDQEQVASSTPLSSGQQPAAQPQGQDSQASQAAPSQPSTVQAGMSSTQAGAAQQPQQSNKPASSGMFTNIQKYVQKNKPQAQKMAGAVTENVGSQASEIADQAKQKQDQMNQSLQANQQSMETQKKEAEGMIQNIMQPQAQQPMQQPAVNGIEQAQQPETPVQAQQPSMEEQQARYQELMQGPQGLTDVGNLNLAEQSQKARALQQMAGQAGTEMGRRNLLQDTFKKQGEYTQGMGGLDQLITSGDAQAREALTTGVQEQANNLNNQLQEVGSETNKAKMAQEMAMKNFGQDISKLSTDAQQSIMDQVNTEVTNQQSLLQQELGDMQFAASKQFQDSLKYDTEKDFYDALSAQFSPSGSKGGQRDLQDQLSIQAMLDPNMDLKAELQKRGLYFNRDAETQGIEDTRDLSNTLSLGYGGTGQDRINNMFEGLLSDASSYGIDPNTYRQKLQDLAQSQRRSDVYGVHGHTKGSKSGFLTYDADKFKGLVGDLYSQMADVKNNALQKQLQNKYGLDEQGAQDFMSGSSIDAAGVATQEQADYMSRLRALRGDQTDMLGTELGDSANIGQDTSFFNKLKEGLELEKNRRQVQTGGAVDSRGQTGGGGGAKVIK